MTFDCYGTLLDWQSAFRRILEPVADGRIEASWRRSTRSSPRSQRDLPTASYKAILREGTARAPASAPASRRSTATLLVDGWHTIEPFPDTVGRARGAPAPGLEARHPDQLRRRPVRVHARGARRRDRPRRDRRGGRAATSRRSGTSSASRRAPASTASDWVHAAVSWWHDMVPARELGLRRVWVDREHSGPRRVDRHRPRARHGEPAPPRMRRRCDARSRTSIARYVARNPASARAGRARGARPARRQHPQRPALRPVPARVRARRGRVPVVARRRPLHGPARRVHRRACTGTRTR